MRKSLLFSAICVIIALGFASCGGGGGGNPGNNGNVDTTTPIAPTGLTVTADSSSSISINWDASTDDVGVAGYRIYRNGEFIKSATALSAKDSGLVALSNYCYTVSAIDAANNESDQSSQVCTSTSSTGPKIASATCVNTINGSCQSLIYNYSNGTVSGIGSFMYVKNIGGSGTVNVTVKAGNFTEIRQFNVAAGTQYVLKSVVPVLKNNIYSSVGNELIVSASFHGTPELTKTNTISPVYVPASGYVAQHWEAFVANGTPDSTLEVDLDYTLKMLTIP